jgi:AcrR family transcriptional regulator
LAAGPPGPVHDTRRVPDRCRPSPATVAPCLSRPRPPPAWTPRARRTRQQLRAALLELARHADLDDIAVGQIAAAADVNRATFYLHYRDKDELLVDAIEALLADTAAAAAAAPTAELVDPAVTPGHTHDFFAALDAHAALYRRLLGPHGSTRVVAHMRDRLHAAVRHELEVRTAEPTGIAPEGTDPDTAPGLDTVAAFIAGAIVGVAAVPGGITIDTIDTRADRRAPQGGTAHGGHQRRGG